MGLIAGTKLGPYEILSPLGAGGMGEVYRGRDTRLDRDVAIKVLPEIALADKSSRKRLRKEAEALSKLSHPNIEILFELNSADNIEFLVVEYVAGITLSDILAKGPLPEREIASLGVQLADGLAAAHAQRVIHRDLKPGNLRVTSDGRLKILDFGIAKLLKPPLEVTGTETTTDTTSANQAIGTLPYMAPEQLRSEPSDGRTDIYAAGAVLYEMATGQRPFRENEAPRLTDAILHMQPVSPRALNPRVSLELERIILKCLRKEPENRYNSAQDLEVDLRQLASPTGTHDHVRGRMLTRWHRASRPTRLALLVVTAVLIALGMMVILIPKHQQLRTATPTAVSKTVRLAVLPFENLSESNEDDYFADGMTAEIISTLSRVRTLEVISRLSVTKLKQSHDSIPEIAKQLDVSYLVSGSVQREGPQVRILVALAEAASGAQIWARDYDRPSKDILGVENEVADNIVESLALVLGKDERAALTVSTTKNPQAFDAYLRGKSMVLRFNNRGLEEDFQSAQNALRGAVVLDPKMSSAYSQQAWLYYLHDIERARATPDRARAQTFAELGLALDPRQVDALMVLAMMYSWSDENEKAYSYAQKALELDPHEARAFMVLGHSYINWGLPEQALKSYQEAGHLDPLYIYPITNSAVVLAVLGRFDQAWDENQKAGIMEPENWGVLLDRIWIRYHQGRLEESGHWVEDAEKHLPLRERPLADIFSGWILSRRGQHEEARKVLDRTRHAPIVQASLNFQLWFAEGLALEGQKDESLDILERVTARKPNYPWLVRNTNLDSLRNDSRFQALMAKLQGQWEEYRLRYGKSASN
ncbi:MAG TPA: protein kinase [Terriglobia bacterium]|nr:protein kinase [Terriglobia bacterium]